MGSASYYIYYRVRDDGLAAARTACRALLDAVEQRAGVRGRVLSRRDQPSLWMEVYEAVPDATRFEAALQEECERLDFDALLVPGESRHSECFVEPARCA